MALAPVVYLNCYWKAASRLSAICWPGERAILASITSTDRDTENK